MPARCLALKPSVARILADIARIIGLERSEVKVPNLDFGLWQPEHHPVGSKALVTMGVGPMQPVLECALPTFRVFAERHGYDMVIGAPLLDCARPQSWWRVPLIRKVLENHDLALWLDADTIILDASRDPADLMPEDAFQALVQHENARQKCPNVGVWLLRKGERTEKFLDAVWESEQYIEHPWWENAAVLKLLGYALRPAYPKHDSPWLKGTHWLPSEWNSHVGWNGLAPARIRHYAGLPNTERIRMMRIDKLALQAAREEGIRRWVSLARYAAGEVSRRPAIAARAALRRILPRKK